MSRFDDFHPIGDGRELKDFLIEHFAWREDGSAVNAEIVMNHLEQTFIIDLDNPKNTREILTAIKAYYQSKNSNLHFNQRIIGNSCGEISFNEPGKEFYDALCITNDPCLLLVTINTILYSYV